MRAVAPATPKVAISDNAVEKAKRPQKVVGMSELLGSVCVKRLAAHLVSALGGKRTLPGAAKALMFVRGKPWK